jgi:hypothetical protein
MSFAGPVFAANQNAAFAFQATKIKRVFSIERPEVF